MTRRDEKQHFYNVSLDTIGNYYSLEEAEAALKTHKAVSYTHLCRVSIF